MGEEQTNKVDSDQTAAPAPAEGNALDDDHHHDRDTCEKTPLVPVSEKKLSPSKRTLRARKAENYEDEKGYADSNDRDAALARVEVEKRLALIKAWEESEKSKADNKAHKKKAAIGSWESTKRASIEAELKQIEEDFEKKKAESAEKMKNKIADMHKEAEEKRATIEAKKGEEILKIEETAENFRATGNLPKKFFGCFSFRF